MLSAQIGSQWVAHYIGNPLGPNPSLWNMEKNTMQIGGQGISMILQDGFGHLSTASGHYQGEMELESGL